MTEYFLGANTSVGFYSAYESLANPDNGDFIWIIKGGPGCGKSSFMRRIARAAEEKGLTVEYVRCSGDPDSLDGIYIPQRKLAYADGTSPHVLEVTYPGACGMYLDLGQFYNSRALSEKQEEIRSVHAMYKAEYAKAYACLSALPCPYIKPRAVSGKKRFCSAVSCQGIITLKQHCPCQKVSYEKLLSLLTQTVSTDILFLHPLWPQLVTSMYSSSEEVCYVSELPIPDCIDAVEYLRSAKKLHDDLEDIYNPHVDFDGVYKLALLHIQQNL